MSEAGAFHVSDEYTGKRARATSSNSATSSETTRELGNDLQGTSRQLQTDPTDTTSRTDRPIPAEPIATPAATKPGVVADIAEHATVRWLERVQPLASPTVAGMTMAVFLAGATVSPHPPAWQLERVIAGRDFATNADFPDIALVLSRTVPPRVLTVLSKSARQTYFAGRRRERKRQQEEERRVRNRAGRFHSNRAERMKLRGLHPETG